MKTHLRGVALLACVAALLASTAAATHAAGRITGGTKVDRSTFDARWQPIVSLRSGIEGAEVLGSFGEDSSLDSHMCGGVLIRPDVVLTAAHCTGGEEGEWLRFLQGRTRVLAGTRTLVDGPTQPGQLIDVAETRVHPNWRGSESIFDESPDSRWDVAVLRLSKPVTGIAPVAMVAAGEDALWGNGGGLAAGARVAGWGVTNAHFNDVDIEEADNAQTGLREVELPLLPDRECESTDSSMGGDARDFDRASMLCGYAADTDPRPRRSTRRGACFGDSGGPLIVPAPDGSWRLAGLVSWGPDAGGGCNRASVFTRIAGVRGWVDATIADFGSPSPLAVTAPTAARQVGASSMRVDWNGATGAPVRYTVLRDMALAQAFPGDFTPGELADEELTPAGIAFLKRLRVLIPVGGGGPEARSLRIDRLEPRRPGQRRTIAFRIEVKDADGRVARSAPLRVQAPIDARRPGMPRARRVVVRRGAPMVAWSAVRDNDCVTRYDVEVRRAGSMRWSRKHVERGDGCGSWALIDILEGGEYEPALGRRYRAPLYRLARGTWFVRVTSVDRAGNRTSSRPLRVRSVRSYAPANRQECISLPSGERICRVSLTTGTIG